MRPDEERSGVHAPGFSDARAPHRSGAPETVATLVGRLKLLVLIRVLTVTVLAVLTLVLEVQGQRSILAGTSDRFLYYLTSGVYVLSLGYTLALRVVHRLSWQRAHAYVQSVFDLLFVALLVLVTRLTDSVFVFLFSLVIVGASIMLPRRGAVVAAVVAAVLFLLIGLVQLNLGSVEAFLEASLGAPAEFLVRNTEVATLSMGRGVAYNLAVNGLAFFSIGLLAAYLAEQIRHAGVIAHLNRARLDEIQALHQDVVKSLPVALVTTDREQNVTYVNPEGLRLLKQEDAEVIGRPVDRFFPDLRAILANDDKLKKQHSELTVQMLSGKRLYLRWTIAPLRSTDGRHVGQLFIFQDVTQLVRMEAEAKRKDRLATVGQLAAGIAHEIRNPLASISGSIQLLRDTSNISEDDRRLMDIVVRETDSLNERISDFLAYARPRKMERTDVDVAELVAETVHVFRNDRRAERLILAVAEPLPEDPRADVDRDGLKQVLWNLLCNAAEATRPGDRVTVGLAVERLDGRDWTRLSVEDSGAGISNEDLRRITEPFFTTKEGGTGLGLATVQRIVEEHGGWLKVESRIGRGSTFSVYVPRLATLEEPVDPTAGEVEADEAAVAAGRVPSGTNLPLSWSR